MLVGYGSINLNLNTYPQIWNHVAIEIIEAANRGQHWVGELSLGFDFLHLENLQLKFFNFDLRMNSTCFECQVAFFLFA